MNWQEVISQHYAVAYDPEVFVLTVNPPATTSQIASLQDDLGFTFPDEWHSLYATTDGFGVAPKEDPEGGFDLFPPIADLPAIVALAREAIAQSHPREAALFVPVLDFANGDYIGYRADDRSYQLYMLSHEAMTRTSFTR